MCCKKEEAATTSTNGLKLANRLYDTYWSNFVQRCAIVYHCTAVKRGVGYTNRSGRRGWPAQNKTQQQKKTDERRSQLAANNRRRANKQKNFMCRGQNPSINCQACPPPTAAAYKAADALLCYSSTCHPCNNAHSKPKLPPREMKTLVVLPRAKPTHTKQPTVPKALLRTAIANSRL